MGISEKLQFVITANASDAVKAFQATGKAADKELGKAETKLDKLGGKLTKFGAGALASAGIAGVGLFKLGQTASDLEESINAVNVTFGKASAGILNLSDNAAKAVGLSKSAFNGLAVQFSSFATTVAGKGGDVVQTMGELTGRAADFASVMNLDVAEAARVFQSGLAGETEPLKKFGIDLSAAAIEAYAAANGIGEVGKQLSEAEKVQARYGALMEQTSKTQGDFANTADGAANQQRVLKAELENVAAAVGSGVLPVMTKAITVIGDLVSGFTALPGPVQKTIGTVATFGTIALGAAGALSFVSGQVIKARDSFKSLGATAGKAGPALAVAGVAVAGLGMYASKTAKDNRELAASIAELTRVSDAELMRQFFEVLADGMIAGKKGEETFRQLAQTQLEGAKRVLEYVDALEANGTATEGQIAVNHKLREAINEEDRARAQAIKTTEEATPVVDDLTAAVEDETEAEEDSEEAIKAAKEAHEKAIQALIDRKKAEEDLYNTLQSQIDKQYAYESAVDAGDDAIAEYNVTLKESKKDLEAIDDATRETAEQLRDQAKAFAESKGANLDSAAGIQAQIEELYRLAVALDEKSPLRARLIKYIGELQAIPARVLTTLDLKVRNAAVSDAIVSAGGAGYSGIPQFADGGVMPGPRGEHNLAWVAGGETVVPTHKSGGGGVGGNTTIYITTKATARQTAQELRRYDRRNGRS